MVAGFPKHLAILLKGDIYDSANSTMVLIGAVIFVIFTAAVVAYTARVNPEKVDSYSRGQIGRLLALVCLMPFFWLFQDIIPWDKDTSQGRIFRFVVYIILGGITAAYLWMIRPRK